MGKGKVTRRAFLGGVGKAVAGGIAGAAVLPSGQARAVPARRRRTARVGANEKVRLGLIGCGGMGTRHLEALCTNDQCTVAAVCDVYRPRFEAAAKKAEAATGKAPDTYQDFRRVLERSDIDAIFVATPDHWHPLLAIYGCEAGKDVYVEKPVCPTVAEGRAMVNAARRFGRVVQAGTQQRSMPVFQKAMEVVHSGRLGTITSATAWVGVNGWNVTETYQPVPDGLDWDLWLGPAPASPYCPERFGGFMGWHDYCRGGQLTNWGVHLVDILHWGIQEDRPLSVQASGGSFREGAGGDNYENVEALLEFRHCTVTWEQRHSNAYEGKGYGMKFNGTDGQLLVDRNSFIVKPDSLGIPEWVGEPERSWANPDHHNNFFHCVRTRERPAADIEQGFRSTTSVLLAGIALKARRKLVWDGDAEQFVDDPEADRYLSRPYRAPWHL